MSEVFNSIGSVCLTPSLASQTISIPAGARTVVVLNTGVDPVFFAWAASVAVPTTYTSGVNVAYPGAVATYPCPLAGGSMSCITTGVGTGGKFVVTFCDGDEI